MSYWNAKVALVTGGSSGLGLAVSRALLERGARTVIAARNAARLHDAASELPDQDRCQTVVADVTRDEDVTRLLADCTANSGRLDALFHCVGISDRGEALATPLARYQELWESNFLAAVRCAQHAAPVIQSAGGHLVLVGSLASKIASRYLGAYPSSKFPLAAFAQQLRLESQAQANGMHVLLVCPGPIARADAGRRYDQRAEGLPESARQPGGGVKLKGLDPARLAAQILAACERRRPELVVPARARLLAAIAQLSPALGDWLVRKFT